jgi:AcrR family transcriptional regulator
MGRPSIHTSDHILDVASRLMLEHGMKAATIEAISGQSKAPAGSIYHQFGSRDDLFAALWTRAAQRSQKALFAAAERGSTTRERVVEGGLGMFDFCSQNRADARLLMSFRRQDLIRGPLTDASRDLVAEVNGPLDRLMASTARELFGSASKMAQQRVFMLVYDLPFGAAHRYLIANLPVPAAIRPALRAALWAAMEA